jgi:hypothetical protein
MIYLFWLCLLWRIKSLVPNIIKIFVGHVEVVACLLELSVIPSSERFGCPILNIFIYGLFLHNTSLCTLFFITSLAPVTLLVRRWTLHSIIAHYSL